MRHKGKLEAIEYRTYGPPGTGKTTWVVAEARRHAERVGPDQISICSLTNTAVSEVVGRDTGLDPDNITTLHARCKRSLGAPAPAETRMDEFREDVPDAAGGLPVNKKEAKEGDEEKSPLVEVILSGGGISLYEHSQILRQQMIPQSAWPKAVRDWHLLWSDWCVQNGIMDFTGWLEEAVDIRPLPAQQVVYVDEAQDHTPLQLEVIRTWNARMRVLVGDDDQNLYAWAGADPHRFFHPSLPQEREMILDQSYRVPHAVHALSQEWIHGVTDRKDKIYHPRDDQGSVSKAGYSLSDVEMGILPDSRLLDGDGRTHMVIASCAYMLVPLVKLMREKGILFHNPFRPTHAGWNYLRSVSQILRTYLIPHDEGRRWTGEEARTWAKVLQAHDVFLPGRKSAFLDYCEDYPEEFISREVLRENFIEGQINRAIVGDLDLLRDYRKTGVPGEWRRGLEMFSLPMGSREPKVIVGTIHSVKGGEADVVHLFPDLSPAAVRDMRDLSDGMDRIRRLFYVGMTRARESLIVYSSQGDYSVSIM